MVHGNAGSVTATLITDDNHLPAATNNYKLRLINGLTGAAVPLTMDVNFGTVASNVQPGAASAVHRCCSQPAAATQISVTSPSSPTPIFQLADTTIACRAAPSSRCSCSAMRARPIGVLRRDR